MKFLSAQFLWLLPAYALFGLALGFLCSREFHRRLAAFVGARIRTPLVEAGALRRKLAKLALAVAALLSLCLALARPLGGLKPDAARQQGVNILIAIDGSASMLTEDVAPNRFELARQGIASLLDNCNGDRIGLVMFGGEATLVSPLTFDTVSLQSINQGLTPELVGKGGTSLAGVIGRAAAFFHDKKFKSKVLILFTDGEETEGDALVAAQDAWKKEGLRIFTVGVGTESGGPIPLMQRDEQRQWVQVGTIRDTSGKEVRSRMDPRLLRAVAEIAGGTYTELAAAKGNLTELYERGLKPLSGPLDEASLTDRVELFQVFLGLALALLVWEMAGDARFPRLLHGGPGAAALLLAGFCATARPSLASAPDAQRLIAAGKVDQAFAVLQKDLLANPEDPLAAYNYGIGAYADGKYDVAIGAFEKLVSIYDVQVANRSCFQLGNSDYRLGEAMLPTNPEGTLALWEKAEIAYSKAPGGDAAFNYAKTHSDVLALLGQMARAKEKEGDDEARISPERGIPAWRDAIAYLDKALSLSPDPNQAKSFADAKAAILDKIFQAYFRVAEDKRSRAEMQKDRALEQAVQFIKEAIANYDEALAIRPDDVAAREGRAKAVAELEPWTVELAEKEHQQGVDASAVSMDDAMNFWTKAAGHFNDVLQQHPDNARAAAGRKLNNHSLHDGHVALGDRKQQEAEAPDLTQENHDGLLEDALGHYESAIALEPGDAATQAKIKALGLKLVGVFVARGQAELDAGKKLAAPKPPEAISWLERSVESFGQALHYDAVNQPATAGKKEAEALLKKLRELDAANQQKILAHSKELKNVEDLKDNGKLPVKLIDYDTDHLASKKQQNFTLPEDKPVKDW